jgi:hypothetical protein
MIIDNTYFTGEIYLPEAKPSITSDVKDVESKVNDFIDDYVYDCLVKCLGTRLATEFIAELDFTEANGLDSGAAAKWDELLNGDTYTNPSGDEVVWRGIRYKSNATGKYNRSFLANYVYYHYESNDDTTRSGVGSVRIDAANAARVSASHRVIKAWRKFLSEVQGTKAESPYFTREGLYGGTGADFYQRTVDAEINLYQFIQDKNNLVADTYENFNPKVWGNMNQLGI